MTHSDKLFSTVPVDYYTHHRERGETVHRSDRNGSTGS